jgi:hypothetical protein
MEKTNNQKLLTHISKRIADAQTYHLEAEVITTALKIIKENPKMTIIEAFDNACKEWDI